MTNTDRWPTQVLENALHVFHHELGRVYVIEGTCCYDKTGERPYRMIAQTNEDQEYQVPGDRTWPCGYARDFAHADEMALEMFEIQAMYRAQRAAEPKQLDLFELTS